MKIKSRLSLFFIPFLLAIFFFSACDNDDDPVQTPPMSTALYDTLGWFIQGAQGSAANQGTKMIDDPDNPGEKIQAGRFAIRTVVNKSLGVIAADPKLAEYFPVLLNEVGNGNTTGLAKLLNTFTDFVQQAVSGQQVYKGKSMVDAHNHATHSRFGSAEVPTADSADFDQFVGDIASAATSLHVPGRIIQQLGDLLYTTEGDVVQDLRPNLETTPLYDTLGWFIQGAHGSAANEGTVMINDPDNPGEKIQAGRFAIRTVVNKALGIIAGDSRLAKYFPVLLGEVGSGNTTGLAKLLNTFTDFVQQAVSGQQVYHGLNMVDAHKHSINPRFGSESTPAVVDEGDFDIFVGDVAQAAKELKVPNNVIAKLGTLLYTTKDAVVQ